MRSILYKLDNAIASIEKAFMMLMSGALTILLITQATMRYLFSSPLFWAEEVAILLLLGITFIGMSYLLHENKLLRIDFIAVSLKPHLKALLDTINSSLAVLLIGFLCWYTYEWISAPEVSLEMSPTTGLPRIINYGLLFLAFCLMLFHQLVKLMYSIDKIFNAGESK